MVIVDFSLHCYCNKFYCHYKHILLTLNLDNCTILILGEAIILNPPLFLECVTSKSYIPEVNKGEITCWLKFIQYQTAVISKK